MGAPLAYFLTWLCYGQRLHGDARGSVDREHNQRGTPYLEPDSNRERASRQRMSGPGVRLLPEWRPVVDRAIDEVCRDRGWRLIAKNVRTTHVHVVVNSRGESSPERAMAALKARATRDLTRAGLVKPDADVWEHHGSTRWLNHEPGLYGAIAYVNDWQTGPNREILEEKKRLIRDQIRALKKWLKDQGLPEDGKTVVVGEDAGEREQRVSPGTSSDVRDEPGTK